MQSNKKASKSRSGGKYKCKDPAILLYTSDFIADTVFLSFEQIGKLALLMAHRHWQRRRLTRDEMLKICKDEAEDPQVFSRYQIDKNGLYFNPAIENAIEQREEYCKSRARNRLGKTKNTTKSYEKHTENENAVESEAFNSREENNI